MKIDIIIAHFNEEMEWLPVLMDSIFVKNIFIYSKDRQSTLSHEKIRKIALENVGRESHTYLYHVVNNYEYLVDNPDNATFFFQGSPHFNFKELSKYLTEMELKMIDYSSNFRVSSPFDFMENGRRPSWNGKTTPSQFDIKDWTITYLNKYIDKNTRIPIFWGACFGVSNNLIIKSNVFKYTNMMTPELKTLNPEEAHYHERLWFFIFNMHLSKLN